MIERVEPPAAMNTLAVPIEIYGSGFRVPLVSDLDNGRVFVGAVGVSIGDVALAGATWRTGQLIEGTVPPGLPVGRHDVTVTIDDRRSVLPEGFEVLGEDVTMPDGAMQCVPGWLDLCTQPPPTIALDVTSAETLDTDTDPRCRTYVQQAGGDVCLVHATSVNIGPGGSLTATGSRPLAIASATTLTLDGTIDVSSRRGVRTGPGAGDASCTFAATPEEDIGGAGGGAGGSFGAIAGNGGVGDSDNSSGNNGTAAAGQAGAAAMATYLRGGCAGQRGANESSTGGMGGSGGFGGGALYLYAPMRVEVNGQIRATGAGGTGGQVQSGGGGGGSGGLVVIESAVVAVTVMGQISANGGGGGEGGGRIITGPISSVNITGQPGNDGDLGMTPAAGGRGSYTAYGFAASFAAGGSGGAGTTAATNGASPAIGAGGGGGSVGIVRLIGTTTIMGVVSPPPI